MQKPLIAQSPADLPPRAVLLSMSGLEYLQGISAGTLPAPAISALMNYRLESADKGRAVLRGAAAFSHTNPFGAVHGGWYGTVLDTALGCAVMSIVPKGRWYTTLEYKVNITRALPLDQVVEVVGEIDHAGRSTAVAHATMRGLHDGRIYATGSTTCIILE